MRIPTGRRASLAPRRQVAIHIVLLAVEPRLAADHPRRGVEAGRQRGPDVAHPGIARGHDRAALFPALHDRAAGAGMVRAHFPHRHGVSPVRPLEFRLAPRARRLPVRGRAVDHDDPSVVVRGARATSLFALLCAGSALYSARARQRRRPASADGAAAAADGPPPRAGDYALVAAALRDGLVHAARRDEPHHARRGLRAVPVDPSPHAVPAHLHPVLRGARLVPAPPGSSARCS